MHHAELLGAPVSAVALLLFALQLSALPERNCEAVSAAFKS